MDIKLTDSRFSAGNSEYEYEWGIYRKDGNPISRSEYIEALKSTPGALGDEYKINFFEEIKILEEYVSSLSVDVPSVGRRRGHLPRIPASDVVERLRSVQQDTGISDLTKLLCMSRSLSSYTDIEDKSRVVPECLEEYLDESPIFDSPPLFRGLGFKGVVATEQERAYEELLTNISGGSRIGVRDFASFSSSLDIAIEFAHFRGVSRVYLILTTNETGVSVDHMTPHEYKEDEVLFQDEAQFEVRDKVDKTLPNGEVITLIHIVEVPVSEVEGTEPLVFELSGKGDINGYVR